MDPSTSNVCVTSYNSGGMGVDKQNYIKTLLLFSDVLCLQEHFLLDSGNKKFNNTYKLRQNFSDTHDMVINPAIKSNIYVSKGRGSGGLAILWRKCLTKYVTNIKCESYRLQAIKFNFPEAELLVINVYLMVDSQLENFDDNGLLQILAELNRIIGLSDCKNILLSGDLNCDFSRNTHFVNIIRDFILEKGLNIFWTMPDNSETQ